MIVVLYLLLSRFNLVAGPRVYSYFIYYHMLCFAPIAQPCRLCIQIMNFVCDQSKHLATVRLLGIAWVRVGYQFLEPEHPYPQCCGFLRVHPDIAGV